MMLKRFMREKRGEVTTYIIVIAIAIVIGFFGFSKIKNTSKDNTDFAACGINETLEIYTNNKCKNPSNNAIGNNSPPPTNNETETPKDTNTNDNGFNNGGSNNNSSGDKGSGTLAIHSSCAEIKANNSNAHSGTHQIKTPSGEIIRVTCDMTTDGGGWTLVSKDMLPTNSKLDLIPELPIITLPEIPIEVSILPKESLLTPNISKSAEVSSKASSIIPSISEDFNILSKNPISTPRDPIIIPNDPIFKPIDPILTPNVPIVRPRDPIIIPNDPILTPTMPVNYPNGWFPIFKKSSNGVMQSTSLIANEEGIQHSEIRVEIQAEFYYTADGFNNTHGNPPNRMSLNGQYVDGISITSGNAGNRTHVHTISPATLDTNDARRNFIGNDLTIGQIINTTFTKIISTSTSIIETRVMFDQPWDDETVAIRKLNVWVR